MLITLIISFEKHGNNMPHCTCLESKLSLSGTGYCFTTQMGFLLFFLMFTNCFCPNCNP